MVHQKPARSGKAAVKVIVSLVVIAAVVALAWYWEPVSFYFKLHGWEPDAPAHTVTDFLEAGRKGNKEASDRLLSKNAQFQPVEQGGKWTGYRIVSNAGTLIYAMNELAPPAGTKPKETEFVYIDPGAALVTMPDAKGKDVKYRLEIIDGTWKITEIRGGRLAK